ncbi:hypothetical protein [Amycolatopsis regifaucium]|uniref:Uncharacterized protein n=1 Tax=Amycolatopsis regifaucium TaxID=546365 RepID=A0A154MVR2_9PSEU|nr:hypothetical protein [Amycolatopsis regifaucium]KZB88381.1 hypothetical protein AVL48_20790 [Amycolatopsis regifaucium]OKA11492.1 hypothetical protein ATP06_0201185 [Amycolatopsis regifaucium]SFH40339.1 hypothetical protein SAMN04489731_10420 [Amycolatopsis regifaucium]
MSQGPVGQAPPQRGADSTSTAQKAKDEAKEVATSAADHGETLAKTAVEEAKHVAEHGQHEARDLLREGRAQLEDQARNGQRQAAQSLHGLADQLDRMAQRTDSPGVAADITRQASERVHTVANWLDEREPGQLLEEVRRFARQRPGTFLAGAAIAGALVGRLTRAAVAGEPEGSSHEAESGQGSKHATPLPEPVAPALSSESSPAPPIPTGQVGDAEVTAPTTTAGPGGYSAPQPPEAASPSGPRSPGTGEVP